MLSWANLIGHVILYDPDGKLRPAFMNELRGLFNLPESFTFDDFIDIKNRDIESQSTDQEKRNTELAYLEFITKIMHLKDGVLSVYQRNYSRESFARSSVPRNSDGSRKDGVLDKVLPISSLECFADLNIDTSSGDSRTYAQRNVIFLTLVQFIVYQEHLLMLYLKNTVEIQREEYLARFFICTFCYLKYLITKKNHLIF